MDVEGAELKALLGAKSHLKQQKIKFIYFECHPSDCEEILALLTSFRYCVYELVNNKLLLKTESDITMTQDLVAIPE